MKWYEILLIVAAVTFVIGVTVWQIIRKVKGKGGCDCGCSDCSSCAACRKKNEQKPLDK